MAELRALYLMFRHAPAAIIYGRFESEGDSHGVYGLPARMIGAALLSLAGFAIGDVVYWGVIRGDWDCPEWYLAARVVHFFGGILVSALLYTVYCERRRDD
jgi:hypothetical protein